MIYCTNKTFIKVFRVNDYGKVKVCEGGTSEKLEGESNYRKSYWKVILRGEALKSIPVQANSTIEALRFKIEATIDSNHKERGPQPTIIIYEGRIVETNN